MRIQSLTSQLQSAQNQWLQLESQVARLKSDATVMQVATMKYGMSMPADPSTVHQINVPGPVVTKVVAVPVPVRSAGVRLGVGATDAAVTSWWQEAWVVLYKLLR
jgi:hypothetical protein